MAEPRKLPAGTWRIRWLDSNGKRRSATFKTYEAARSALRRASAQVEDVRAGRSRPLSDQTIAAAAETWLASRKPGPKAAPAVRHRQEKRHTDNRQHLERHILPRMGTLRLPEVTAAVFAAFIKRLQGTPTKRGGSIKPDGAVSLVCRTLAPSTVRNIVVTLRKMLADLGYPVRVSVKVPRTGYNWLRTDGEVIRFLDACGEGWFRVAASLSIYSGLRFGEVAAITWHAVDFERGIIVVDRSWQGPTKNNKPRTLPLADELAALLKRWRLKTGGSPRDLVVRDDSGKGLQPSLTIARMTRRACRRAKIEPVTFHQLRHTFASRVAETMPLPAVKELLGHADITTTARYAHADGDAAARDPRARLSFGAKEAAEVIVLRPVQSSSGTD